MLITLEEAKTYLRVDSSDEDALIQNLVDQAEQLVMDVARLDQDAFQEKAATTRVATLYAIAYFFEHREDADYHELVLTLRAILFGVREAKF